MPTRPVAMVPSSVGRNSEKLHIPFGMFRLFSYLCAVNSFRPLSKRLTYRIMVVVLVMIVVITGIVYFHVGHYMFDEAQERYEGALLRDHEEFRRRLSDVMVAAKNNIEDMERDVDDPEKIIGHLERILRVNPTIITCGIIYQPNYFPDRKRCLELIATHDSTGTIHSSAIENDYNVYMDRKWFLEGMSKDTALWTEVYFEENLIPGVTGRRQLTTYTIPVHNSQGKVVAMMGADLPLEFLKYEIMDDLREKSKKHEKGCKHHSYNFVIGQDGTYIIHPDEKRILHANFFEECQRTTNKVDDHVMASMRKGEKGSALVEIDGIPSWIYYRTVKHMDWMIAIVVPEEVIFRNGRTLNTIILIVVLVGLVAIYFICRRMIHRSTQPLHSLALSAEEVAKGNFESPLPDVRSFDEIRVLRDSFEVMQTSLSIYVDEVRNTTAEKAASQNEMNNARDIQMTMVPSQFPPYPERSDIDIYGVMEPAKSVGGDLFDFLIRDEHLYFCIGDVSGKGVPAALLMAVTRSLFHSISLGEERPDHIMWRINRAICEGNKNNMFVTMFIGILDLTTGHLDYCNAGHEAPLLAGQQLPVKRNKPVGALPDWNFEAQETRLQPGDVLFLYSDGLSEARNQTGKRLGRAYVAQLASQHTHDTAQQLVELMAQEVKHYAADTEQSDDITLLAIKWLDQGDTLILQASMEEIDRLKPFIEHAASRAGMIAKETKRLRAAVEEAVANVIHYGQATTITLQAEKTDGQLLITIDDDGLPFDPTQGSATDLSIPTDQRPPGGMGIIMLQRMTDGLSYQRTDGHNILTLIKTLNIKH